MIREEGVLRLQGESGQCSKESLACMMRIHMGTFGWPGKMSCCGSAGAAACVCIVGGGSGAQRVFSRRLLL
jgi:hypothetical protein